MSDAPIRVLLIGTSFGGSVHAPGFAGHPDFQLMGVASGHIENARRVAEVHGVPLATRDWKKMLEEVDAEFQQEVHGRFLEECRAGKVDRQELNCLLGSDDEVVRLQCVVDGEKRAKRNPFLPR